MAENSVKVHRRDVEALSNGVLRALAQASIFGLNVTGIVDATDLETTAPHECCGHVTRTRTVTDTQGTLQEIEVTVFGWQVIILIDARSKMLLALKVVPIQAPETLFLRALGMQARTNLSDDTYFRGYAGAVR